MRAVHAPIDGPHVCALRLSACERHVFRIVLVLAFEMQKVVVTAVRFGGILPAESGSHFINRAAPLLLVEERADLAEVVIFLVTQRAHLCLGVELRKALFGLLEAQVEVLCDTRDIALADFNQIVTAAISGTL